MKSISRTWYGLSLVVLAFAFAIPGAALAEPAKPGGLLPGGLLIAQGRFGGVLEIKEHVVHVTINNGIAITRVDQVFLNTENRIVEALYTFPVPNGASVSNFSMVINGKEMIGEVVEKERARQIYESYKAKKIDPGLLEQVNFKRFEMRIFPIAAGAEQKVSITYYQELDFDHDWATYVYPLATTTEPGIDQKVTGKFAFTMDVKSAIPITKLKSTSHDADFITTQPDENYVRASLETSGGSLDRDVVISFQTKRARTGIDVITSKESGTDGYYMLTLTAGEELKGSASGMDYVFVMDISGSMANDQKLTLSRLAGTSFINSLGPEDRCEVITFNVAANPLFNSLNVVDSEAKQAVEKFLASQQAKGGTSLRPAVNLAFQYKDADRPMNVVIMSDGMTEQREQRELVSLINKCPAGTRIFCVGIGNETNRPLLRQLAEGAGGMAAFVSQGDDFNRQAEAFRRKLTHPVGTNLSIEVNDVDGYDVTPQKLPNLFHGSPIRMYGRYRKASPANIVIRGEVMGRPFEQTVSVPFPDVDAENPQIERMWAWHQVQQLMNVARATGSDSSVKDPIVNLCETYSIVSEYASFIVLENDAEYRRWKIKRRNNDRIQRDRFAQNELRVELQKLRDKAIADLGPKSKSKSPNDRKQLVSTKAKDSSQPRNTPSSSRSPSGQDLNVAERRPSETQTQPENGDGGGGGGGAIDPITGLIGAGFAIAAAAARRRKKRMEVVSDKE